MDNHFGIFMQAAARFMVADRPDIFPNEDSAKEALVEWYMDLSEDDEDNIGWSTGGFTLRKIIDDDVITWVLERSIAQLTIFPEENIAHIYNWAHDGAVVGKADLGIPPQIDKFQNTDDD